MTRISGRKIRRYCVYKMLAWFFLSSVSSIEYSKLSDHPDFKGNTCLPRPSLIIPAFSRTFIEPILFTAHPACIRCNLRVSNQKTSAKSCCFFPICYFTGFKEKQKKPVALRVTGCKIDVRCFYLRDSYNLSATLLEDAGFCPVIKFPSLTT